MKRILILVVSSQKKPYNVMAETSYATWDSVEVEGVESIFYFSQPYKPNTKKNIYFDVDEQYSTMGYKMLGAFEYALKNCEFDYIARVNSSCYVDKKELIKYVQNIPTENLFQGLIVPKSEHEPEWIWGGGQFLISKDVIEKFVANKESYNHSLIEDIGISRLANVCNIPYTNGVSCTIDKTENGWRVINYGFGENQEFESFEQFKPQGHFFYRVKCDWNRNMDTFLMNELYNKLK